MLELQDCLSVDSTNGCIQYDLDLGHVTLILDLDLDVLKTHMRTKIEICRSSYSKVKSPNRTDTQTD